MSSNNSKGSTRRQMKSKNHMFIKENINKTLAVTLKTLHLETSEAENISKANGYSKDALNQFLSIVEAALVHGIKASNFEKRKKSKDLPLPHLWNVLTKISHKSTINQINKMKLIKSNVGKSRAWIRSSLNEKSFSSYIYSILNEKPLLKKHYESYALMLDFEQADIFSTRIQMTCQMDFDFATNSSLLNTWTRTPLELSGILETKTLDTNNTWEKQSNQIKEHSAIKRDLGLSSNNIAQSAKVPITSSPLTSSQRKFSFQKCSPAFSTILNKGSENLLGSSASTNNDNNDILHKRQLKKKNKKNRASYLETSSIYSASSINSTTSSNIICHKRNNSVSNASVQGKVSSSSSKNTSPLHQQKTATEKFTTSENQTTKAKSSVDKSDKYFFENLEKQYASEENLLGNIAKEENEDATDRSKILQMGTNLRLSNEALNSSLNPSPVKEVENDDNLISEKNQQDTKNDKLSTVNTSNLDDVVDRDEKSNLKEFDNTLNKQNIASTDLDSIEFKSSENIHSKTSEETKSKSESSEDDDPYAVDIYADNSSGDDIEVLSNGRGQTPDLFSQNICSGVGNSLVNSVGNWSSTNQTEHNENFLETSQENCVGTYQPCGKTDHESVVCREGYLQKRATASLFWKTYWFVLDNNSLCYYKDKVKQTRAKEGEISLFDIQQVNDSQMDKKNVIVLKMADGSSHRIYSENHKDLLGWYEDITRMCVKSKGADNLSSEDEFVILENSNNNLIYDEILPSNYVQSTRGVLGGENLLRHITNISNEKGLDAQNYQCAACSTPIGIIYEQPRLCSFTSCYFCSSCHLNESIQIPSRIIHNWDLSKHKVAKSSKEFLQRHWRFPCINIYKVNSSLYHHVPILQIALKLRCKILHLKPYFETCRFIDRGKLDKLMRGHYHALDDCHLYSVYELIELATSNNANIWNEIVKFGINHVTTCQLCRAKGFICEICKSDEIIFPFEDEKVYLCEICNGVFHKNCFESQIHCPKCERRNKLIDSKLSSSFSDASV